MASATAEAPDGVSTQPIPPSISAIAVSRPGLLACRCAHKYIPTVRVREWRPETDKEWLRHDRPECSPPLGGLPDLDRTKLPWFYLSPVFILMFSGEGLEL